MASNMRSIHFPKICWMCAWSSSFCCSSKMSWGHSSESWIGVGGGVSSIISTSISKFASIDVIGISTWQLRGISSSTKHFLVPLKWSRLWVLRGKIYGWGIGGGVKFSRERISSLIGTHPRSMVGVEVGSWVSEVDYGSSRYKW